jgi:predicted 3-demethylubiquinone-9 3-methyltransferase (glyoxalase superfamily)
MAAMQKITINLWFDDKAEEAAKFYASIFKNSGVGRITRYGKEGHEIHGKKEGTAMTVEFRIEGQEFVALNGGPQFKFTEAVSFIVRCETQAEVDYFWDRLGEGGDPKAQQCGWLKDRYGISWQIIPVAFTKMINDPDPEKSQRVVKAMFTMKKLDIGVLRKAYEGRG